jgi:hypothetical protein
MMFEDKFWGHGILSDGEIIKVAQEHYGEWLVTIGRHGVETWFTKTLIDREAFLFVFNPGGAWHVVYSNGHCVFDSKDMDITPLHPWTIVAQTAMLRGLRQE